MRRRAKRLRILTTALVLLGVALLISPTYPWLYSYQGPDGISLGMHLVSWLDPLVWLYGNWFPVVAVLLAAVALLRPTDRLDKPGRMWIPVALTTASAVAAWLALQITGVLEFPSLLAPCVLSLAVVAALVEMGAAARNGDTRGDTPSGPRQTS